MGEVTRIQLSDNLKHRDESKWAHMEQQDAIPSQRLPLELQFLILDVISRYSQSWLIMRGSLRSCALTCQAWLPQARRHLYHAVYLDDPWQTPLFARTLTVSPSIGPLIKHLHLPYFSYIVVDEYGSQQRPFPGYVPFTPVAVSNVSSLRSVTIKVPRKDYDPSFWLQLIGSFSVLRNLESLSIHNAMCPFPGILHLIWSFPALRSVELDNCGCYNMGPPADVNACPNRCRDLRDLKIRRAIRVGPFLNKFAEAVETSSILIWRHTVSTHDHYGGLRRFSQLKVLDLGTCNWDITWVTEALSNVRSDKMQRLALTVRSHETPLETVIQHWSASGLDDILSAPPFLRLEEFEFNLLCTGFEHAAAREEIVRILPQCHGRGIFRLHMKPYEPAV
ncbi:hypothetical protein C8T65DRAFT_94918 [Cerioporus squamosus]|nr:hypothetical protein C8T65DRAFT_94918 [Cerioporus squamosus]